MSVSPQQMMEAMTGEETASASVPAPGSIPSTPGKVSPQEMMEAMTGKPVGGSTSPGKPLASVTQPLLNAGKETLTGLWKTYNENIDSAVGKIKQGVSDMRAPQDETKVLPLQQWKGLGEGLLGIGDLIWSPAQTVIDEAVSKPSQLLVNKASQAVGGNPNTTKDLNNFLDVLYNTVAGLKGSTKAFEGEGKAALELLTPEARKEYQERTPRAAAKVDSAFAELAAKAPEDAYALADKTAEVSPLIANLMKKTVDEWVAPSEAELNKLAEDHAAQQISELEGKLPNLQDFTVKRDALGTPLNVAATTKVTRRPEVTATQRAEVAAEGLSQSLEQHVPAEPKTNLPAAVNAPKHTMMHSGIPLTRQTVEAMWQLVKKVPGVPMLEGAAKLWYDFMIRQINPEALGPEAKKSAAILAKGVAELAQKDSKFVHQSEGRKLWWEKNLKHAEGFIEKFERGEAFTNPELKAMSQFMTDWNKQIFEQDQRNGIEYEARDHYLSHVFEDPKAVEEWANHKFGPSWTKPGFTKDRGFNLYSEAKKAGFKPKFTNPEDIMIARQHASDAAQMKIEALGMLEKYGMAVTKTKGGKPPGLGYGLQASPAGGSYWVKNDALAVLHNAFNTQSLWNLDNPVGQIFRGAMWLKNTLMPIQLGLSLYHPLHVLTIHNATSMVRASKELLAGASNPGKWLMGMVHGTFYKGLIADPIAGHNILNAFKGKISDSKLTQADKVSLKLMGEGGFIPEMSSQYRTKAIDNLKMAIARRSATAAYHLPFAALQALQAPLFEHWIPSLKIASYLADVRTALKINPALLTNEMDRIQALRKLSKSVDNRYGEMAYNTMFWNRWVKDIAVANTLSLGWQLGFIREYGGGMLDAGQALTRDGSLAKKAAEGMLDRPLFVTFYTAQSLAYGGLMTWAMTKQAPTGLMDYINPRTGETNPDGSPARVSTMFYAKEFASIYKHGQVEGAAGAAKDIVESKASGLIGLATEAASGVNSWGDEIRDPDAPAYKKIEQTLAAMSPELQSFSLQAINKLPGDSFADKVKGSPWKAAGAVAGFNPAPKYITQSLTDAKIDKTYNTYYKQKQTPFEKAQYSKESHDLRDLYNNGDMEAFGEKLDDMREKYELTSTEVKKLKTNIRKGVESNVKKFEGFEWQQQKKLLDEMTDDERAKFLPHSNKQHLRRHYEAPETAE